MLLGVLAFLVVMVAQLRLLVGHHLPVPAVPCPCLAVLVDQIAVALLQLPQQMLGLLGIADLFWLLLVQLLLGRVGMYPSAPGHPLVTAAGKSILLLAQLMLALAVLCR
jgi:hypothetical protein